MINNEYWNRKIIFSTRAEIVMRFINIFRIYCLRVRVIHYIIISAKFQREVAELRVLYLWGSVINVIIQKFYVLLTVRRDIIV
jgi:hypothetical protein